MMGFAFLRLILFLATIFCHTTLLFLLRNCLPQSYWVSLGLPFILLPMAQYGHWFFYYITGGLLCPICFLLGVPDPFAFLGLSWPFSKLCIPMGFYWVLWVSLTQLHYPSSLGLIGLPLTSYFLCFYYFGPAVAHSHFSTSYTAYGFLFFFSFRAPLSPFASSRPICLSYGHVIHYSCHLGLMSFLSIY